MEGQLDFDIEELKAWGDSRVTKEFMERINLLMQDADNMVHLALEKNEKEEAALHNAGMRSYREVLDIPEIIKEDLKEEHGKNN